MQLLYVLTRLAQAAPTQAQSGENTDAIGRTNFDVGPGQDIELPKVEASADSIKIALGAFFGVLGAVAVVYIIIGGISYIYSSGEPQKAKQAKDTIIYAVIGLVVALMAETFVWTVLNRL